MNQMIKKLVLLGLIIAVVFIALDFAVTRGLRRSEHLSYKMLHEIYSGKLQSQTLIQGSSRALVDVSPAIIDKRLKTHSANLGMHTYRMDFQLARYVLYRHFNAKPSLIIQTLDFFALETEPGNTSKQHFLPYFSDPDMVKLLLKYGTFQNYDTWLPFVRYRGSYQSILMGLLEFFHIKHFVSYRDQGYEPRDLKWNSDFENFKKTYPHGLIQKFDKRLLKDFENFLDRSRQEGIPVVLVYLPEYIESQKLIKNRNEIIGLYQALAQKYGLVFIDFSSDPICLNRDYFYNALHLNRLGSELITEKICDRIVTAKLQY